MIIDAHCHAWRRWPYQPPVPDPDSRAVVEQLLFEMDQHGVEQAVVICARLDDNPDNNDYVAACVRRFPARLHHFADVDCSWTTTYQAPGAAGRLAEAAHTYRLRGFTHYVRADDEGTWYLSAEGTAFFNQAAEHNLIASLALPARLQPTLRELARRFPTVPFLCHHMAGARVEGAAAALLGEILASAALPNIHVKLSGFHYVARLAWEYPYAACAPIVRALYEQFGPERLHWGSDYPVRGGPPPTSRRSRRSARTATSSRRSTGRGSSATACASCSPAGPTDGAAGAPEWQRSAEPSKPGHTGMLEWLLRSRHAPRCAEGANSWKRMSELATTGIARNCGVDTVSAPHTRNWRRQRSSWLHSHRTSLC